METMDTYAYDQTPAYAPGTQPPVTVAPIPTQVVTVPAPVMMTMGQRDWDSNLCGGCVDMEICCCVFLCSPFYQCVKMADFNEDCCNAWPCCWPASLLALRYQMRHKENITGSLSGDQCAVCFCTPCVTCQLFHEKQLTLNRAVVIQPMAGISTQYVM